MVASRKGIEKVAIRFAVQTAVYWANPVSDGFTGFTFDAPVEVKCRWEDRSELMFAADGREFTCNSAVLLTEDVDLGGYLFLGTLADLISYDLTKPVTIDNAYPIRRFDRTSMVRKTDEFVRTAYLYYYGQS